MVDNKPCVCKDCDEIFESIKLGKFHVSKLHGIPYYRAREGLIRFPDREIHTCGGCHKGFKVKDLAVKCGKFFCKVCIANIPKKLEML